MQMTFYFDCWLWMRDSFFEWMTPVKMKPFWNRFFVISFLRLNMVPRDYPAYAMIIFHSNLLIARIFPSMFSKKVLNQFFSLMNINDFPRTIFSTSSNPLSRQKKGNNIVVYLYLFLAQDSARNGLCWNNFTVGR